MSGKVLFAAKRQHRCEPNRNASGLPAGSIWQCDCGQHWLCDGPLAVRVAWIPISGRVARRRIRRAQRKANR